MLFRKTFLDGIRKGAVTLAFRRWRRPSVREGGTIMTPAGALHIGSVRPVALDSITEADARHAGYASREALLADLTRRAEGAYYRIELGPLRPDPRITLRDAPATGEEYQTLRKRLRQLDARAGGAPWTLRILDLVRTHAGVRAGDLCGLVDQEKERFKRNVRTLKNLGLVESLGTGYRLSVRGAALLDALRSEEKREAT